MYISIYHKNAQNNTIDVYKNAQKINIFSRRQRAGSRRRCRTAWWPWRCVRRGVPAATTTNGRRRGLDPVEHRQRPGRPRGERHHNHRRRANNSCCCSRGHGWSYLIILFNYRYISGRRPGRRLCAGERN